MRRLLAVQVIALAGHGLPRQRRVDGLKRAAHSVQASRCCSGDIGPVFIQRG
jgi:hypothetical protein